MSRYLFILALMLPLLALAQDLVILHTNDMHSHLNGFSPEAEYTPLVNDNDPTRGGFSRIAGFINTQKEAHGDKVLVLDAGDFLMGTLFQNLELTEGFQLNLMKKMGYEFVALGNHEFDFGADSLAKIINLSRANGEIPQIILSNYKGSTKSGDTDFLKLFDEGIILPHAVTEVNGYKIGLFALIGEDAEESIPQNHGVEFYKARRVARNTARYLKRHEKVDLVIALSHSGVRLNQHSNWAGEDIELGESVSEIDLIISGHSHSYMPVAAYAGTTPVVQTGSAGTSVGRVEVVFDSFKRPLFQTALHAMDDNIVADAGVQQLIDEKVEIIENNILSEIGVGYYDHIVETTFDLVKNEAMPDSSNLGPFVANAIRYYVNENTETGVDIALVASGVIRNNIVTGNKGLQNINDVFNVMPLGMGFNQTPGSPLGLIYVSGNELKRVIELILAVHESRPSFYLYFSGMEIDYSPNRRVFRKISTIRVGDNEQGFRDLDISRRSSELVSITANVYMISFIGMLKKMSMGLVNVTPKDEHGQAFSEMDFIIDLDPETDYIEEAKEWLSIYHYIQSFDDTTGNGIPNIPEKYRSYVNPLFIK